MLVPEPLHRALEQRRASRQDLVEMRGADLGALCGAAEGIRRQSKGMLVTFSKKAFFNVANLCSDSCSYCTYKAGPGDAKLSLLDMGQVRDLAALARKSGCVEALLVAGERPEDGYAEARSWLRSMGFSSTAEYLAHASEAALDAGLFPHTNAGNLRPEEMKELRRTNASIGMMLESSSPRLSGDGMPHRLAPSKRPEARLGALEAAGRLGIPVTTGILVGIGETYEETVDSLLAIRELHERHGNIQEVIVQNFRPNPDTAMRGSPPAGRSEFMRIVALARIAMPDMNIQVPPNLSPGTYHEFLGAGINDWGGVSPLTPDHVNPGFAWPDIGRIEELCAGAGYRLACRFPVYPEFMHMVDHPLRERIARVEDGGLVAGGYWR